MDKSCKPQCRKPHSEFTRRLPHTPSSKFISLSLWIKTEWKWIYSNFQRPIGRNAELLNWCFLGKTSYKGICKWPQVKLCLRGLLVGGWETFESSRLFNSVAAVQQKGSFNSYPCWLQHFLKKWSAFNCYYRLLSGALRAEVQADTTAGGHTLRASRGARTVNGLRQPESLLAGMGT